ncbi:MAG TPA: VOC family protein [Acidimicrobiales bacterium]|nr:VOC family protein [Acidimicrobiales bacterium]
MTPVPSAFGLVAGDLPRTLAFYRALGLDIPPDADEAPHVDVPLPGGFRLMIDSVDTITSFDPSWSPPTGSPRAGLAFECDSPADVDKTYAELVDAGFDGHLEPWDAFWGQRYASLRDPDGTGVDLFAALPTG